MEVAIAVPRMSDGGRRDELWAYVGPWWANEFGWPIHEGTQAPGSGLFNIAAARNRAAAAAGDWDVIVLLDADVLPADPAQVRRATEVAATTGRMTLGHDRWRSLDRAGSDRVMGGWCGNWGRYVSRTIAMSWSNIVAVPRQLWEDLGGQDERFEGWGFEDMAFMVAAKNLGGGLERAHGDVFHLWHPRSPEKEKGQPAYQANRALRTRYVRADGNVEAIRSILAERHQ